MTNCFNMLCPECGRDDRIDILAETWVRLREDGTAADEAGCGDHHFTSDSTAACGCGHWATVAEFEKAGAP